MTEGQRDYLRDLVEHDVERLELVLQLVPDTAMEIHMRALERLALAQDALRSLS